jgi:uncharacterized protein YjbI with pentapeptide repeats
MIFAIARQNNGHGRGGRRASGHLRRRPAKVDSADFRGAILDHTNFNGKIMTSARIDAAQENAVAGGKNLERAFME